MSDLMKTCLRELSQDLNMIQKKKKELVRKYDLDSKYKILNEIILIRDKTKKTVKNFLRFSSIFKIIFKISNSPILIDK